MKSKSKWFIIGGISGAIIIVALICGFIFWPRKFQLDTAYYGKSGLHEISVAELQQLIDEKKSFGLFIYQSSCESSANFEKVLTEFSEQNQIQLEMTSFSYVRKSGLVGDLKYYPSFALYHDGKLVTFLDADSDSDISYYQSVAEFTEWWKKYVQK